MLVLVTTNDDRPAQRLTLGPGNRFILTFLPSGNRAWIEFHSGPCVLPAEVPG